MSNLMGNIGRGNPRKRWLDAVEEDFTKFWMKKTWRRKETEIF